jgi:hypothetical protein
MSYDGPNHGHLRAAMNRIAGKHSPQPAADDITLYATGTHPAIYGVMQVPITDALIAALENATVAGMLLKEAREQLLCLQVPAMAMRFRAKRVTT